MFKMALERTVWVGLGCTWLVACGASGDDNAEGRGDLARLTTSERSVYVDDAHYLQKRAAPGRAVLLNFADPAQYRFAQARLKLAGKTAIHSPHLFEIRASHRHARLLRGRAPGTFAPRVRAAAAAAVSGSAQDMHCIEETNLRDRQATPQMSGTAASTSLGGTDCTYVDLSISSGRLGHHRRKCPQRSARHRDPRAAVQCGHSLNPATGIRVSHAIGRPHSDSGLAP